MFLFVYFFILILEYYTKGKRGTLYEKVQFVFMIPFKYVPYIANMAICNWQRQLKFLKNKIHYGHGFQMFLLRDNHVKYG